MRDVCMLGRLVDGVPTPHLTVLFRAVTFGNYAGAKVVFLARFLAHFVFATL
jgi:hypothetical protein